MILTKQLLTDYALKEREIKRLEDKLEYFANKIPKSEHGVVMGSMKDFPYAPVHFVLSGSDIKSDNERQERIKSLIITISERRQTFLDLEISVGEAIENISDAEMREIIELKYIKGYTDQEIAEEFGYERSAITKKLSRFFENQCAKC